MSQHIGANSRGMSFRIYFGISFVIKRRGHAEQSEASQFGILYCFQNDRRGSDRQSPKSEVQGQWKQERTAETSDKRDVMISINTTVKIKKSKG